VFVTAKLSGLTDSYFPYHVSDTTGLADSLLRTTGRYGLSLGGTSTAATGSAVAVYSEQTLAASANGDNLFDWRAGSAVSVGAFTGTTFYKLFLDAATGAATNFTLYSNGGNNYFGGNVGILTTTPGGSSTVGTGVLSIGNGTPSVGGVANQVSLFSADVSSSAELFGMDEAGNKPQLTPHPSRFLDTLPLVGREYPWAYSSSNPYIGLAIDVDMMGMVRAVERLTKEHGHGEKFIFLTELPPEERADWDEGQEAQRALREQAIDAAQAQIIALNDQIAGEPDLKKAKELVTRRDAVTVPVRYKMKAPPVWMRRLGVVSKIEAN
jgi:hypothetical protein